MSALSNPFNPDAILWRGCPCGLHASMWEHQQSLGDGGRYYATETTSGVAGEPAMSAATTDQVDSWSHTEDVMANVATSAILNSEKLGLFAST